MSSDKIVETELGTADKLTMDEFIRTLIAQMFENDNEVGTLVVQLEGSGSATDPEVEVEVTLKSINGVPVGDKE